MTTLADVCTIIMGQAPAGDSYNNRAEGLPLIAGAGDFGATGPAPTKYTTRPGKLSAEGDIVLSIRASIGAKIWADDVYCLGRGVASLRAGPRIDRNFLWHWLTNATPALAAKGRGATFLQVSRHDISEMVIDLPSLEEQHRIAGVLDCAHRLVLLSRRASARLEELEIAFFQNVFGRAETSATRLGEIADVVSGLTKGRRTAERTSPVPYLTVANVQAGHLRLDEVKKIEATESEIRRYTLWDGDLVLTEGGDADKLGRGAIWREQLPLCLHQNHIFRVRLAPDAPVSSEYLNGYMAGRAARAYFLRSAKQTTGIASINAGQVRALPVPTPPTTLQRRYAERLQAARTQQAAIARASAVHEELFASLQARAFRGEL